MIYANQNAQEVAAMATMILTAFEFKRPIGKWEIILMLFHYCLKHRNPSWIEFGV